jgi:hypothetical protein
VPFGVRAAVKKLRTRTLDRLAECGTCDFFTSKPRVHLAILSCWYRVAFDELRDRIDGDPDGSATIHAGKFPSQQPSADRSGLDGEEFARFFD